MSSRRRSVVVEGLENRSYAASSKVAGKAAEPALPPMTPLSRTEVRSVVLSGALAYVDSARTLHVKGTYGDDRVSISAVAGHSVRIEASTSIFYRGQKRVGITHQFWEGTARRFDRAMQAVGDGESGRWSRASTMSFRPAGNYNAYYDATEVLACAGGFDRIVVEGGDGADTLSVRGLSSVPVTWLDVEQSDVPQNAAPPGQTPSDPDRSGKYRRGGAWDKINTLQREVANDSRATAAFFGDSHADLFPKVGHAAWQAYFHRATALGIGGDTTRQLLTRIEDGVFDQFKPSTLVVSVGANNVNNAVPGTDAQVTAGILAVIDALRAKLPRTRILLIGMVPRIRSVLDERVRTVNAAVANAAREHHFTFVDTYDRFAVDTGRLLTGSSHYTAKGYSALAALLNAALRDI